MRRRPGRRAGSILEAEPTAALAQALVERLEGFGHVPTNSTPSENGFSAFVSAFSLCFASLRLFLTRSKSAKTIDWHTCIRIEWLESLS